MTKFLSVLSFFLLSLGMFNVSYAACGTINLTCTQDLELSWTSTGQDPNSCNTVGGTWPGQNECNSSSVPGASGGWVRVPSANINEGTSYFTFRGEPISGVPPQMTDTCTVVKPTNCNPTGTYSISANPNPVQICSPATLGSSTISWTAPAGQAVVIYVNESPTMVGTGNGSDVAPWIQVGTNYVFTLRKANTPTVVEASVTVTGTNSGCSTSGTGYCGDSIVQVPNTQGGNEQCDLGSQNGTSGSTCSATCQTVTAPVCGNGVVEGTEQCDLGVQNGQSGSACSASCQTVSTGNEWYSCRNPIPMITTGTCTNEGTFASQAACQAATGRNCYNSNSCGGVCGGGTLPQCGNGEVDPGEQCGEPGLSCGANSTCNSQTCTCQATTPTNLYYRCPAANSGQSCTTSTSQPCAGAPGCFSLSSNPQAAVQCAQYCGAQLYTCAGDCIPCGQPGQVTCGPGATPNPSCNFQCQSTPSCGLIANPTTQTVGQTVGLTLTKSTIFGGIQTEWGTCTVNANGVQTVSANENPWTGVSGAITLGSNVFSALCNYTQYSYNPADPDNPIVTGGSAQCAASTVTGTTGASETRYLCSSGTGPCTQTTCNPSSPTYATCMSTTYATQSACESATSCNATPSTDIAECVGGQATIVSPVNQRVLSGQPFTVSFSFRNIGNTSWSNPTYQVTTTDSTYTPWKTVFGTKALSPSPIAGILGGSGVTNLYSQAFNAPVVTSQTTYNLGFAITKNSTPFNAQCLVNGNGQITVHVPQCNDGIDNDGDGAIDCGVENPVKGQPPIPADPGCFPNGNGGGGACNVSDDDETNNTGANMSITANPQLVRQNGSSNVTFTCDAGTWSVTGPQVNNITGVARDTTSPGCAAGNVFCGTVAVTNKVFPAMNLQVKETYTLRCSGRERSATISVIKINEI